MKLLMESVTPDNPTVAVRWCLNKAEQEALLKVKERVFVLISIAYENEAEDRFLCSVEEAMTHLVFRFAGKHKVFSRLIWSFSDEIARRKFESILLERMDSVTYSTQVLSYHHTEFQDGFAYSVVDADCFSMGSAEVVEIDVDKDHFAKEPPQWLKSWVNEMYNTPPRDQCEFRRRAIWAFSAQPLIILVAFVLYFTIATICLFVGVSLLARGLQPRFILQPGVGKDEFVWKSIEINYTKRLSLWSWEDKMGNLKPWRLLVTPLFLVVETLILEYWHARLDMGYFEMMLTAGRVVLGAGWKLILANFFLLVIAVVIVVAVAVAMFLIARYVAQEKAKQKEIEESPELRATLERQREEAWMKVREEAYAYLTCSTSMVPSLKALPSKRRTLKLRFQDMKRDVCRPYAR